MITAETILHYFCEDDIKLTFGELYSEAWISNYLGLRALETLRTQHGITLADIRQAHAFIERCPPTLAIDILRMFQGISKTRAFTTVRLLRSHHSLVGALVLCETGRVAGCKEVRELKYAVETWIRYLKSQRILWLVRKLSRPVTLRKRASWRVFSPEAQALARLRDRWGYSGIDDVKSACVEIAKYYHYRVDKLWDSSKDAIFYGHSTHAVFSEIRGRKMYSKTVKAAGVTVCANCDGTILVSLRTSRGAYIPLQLEALLAKIQP